MKRSSTTYPLAQRATVRGNAAGDRSALQRHRSPRHGGTVYEGREPGGMERDGLVRGGGGFSMVEVIVSMVIFAVAVATIVPLALNSMRTTVEMQYEQHAASVGQNILLQLENVHRVQDDNDCIPLLIGRRAAVVRDQTRWTKPGVDLSKTNLVEQPNDCSQTIFEAGRAQMRSFAHVSSLIYKTTNIDGVDYKSTSYIGECYRSVGGSDCQRTDPGNGLLNYRIIVHTEWDSGRCGDEEKCYYTVSSVVSADT